MSSLSFILGDKIVENVQIYPQTTELWPKQQIVTLYVSESVSDTLFRKIELSFCK